MPNYRSNQEIIRAGSRERITFTLYADNQVYNLISATECEIRLKKLNNPSYTKIYSSADPVPIVSFDTDRASGKIHLDPAADTFQNGMGLLKGYINVKINNKWYAFEEDEEFGIMVRDNFTTTTSTSTTTTI